VEKIFEGNNDLIELWRRNCKVKKGLSSLIRKVLQPKSSYTTLKKNEFKN